MDETQVRHVLSQLGVSVGMRTTRGWLNAQCPFARYSHVQGTDNSPSFAISISPGDVSYFKCWGCNTKGTLTTLVWRLEKLSGKSYADLGNYVMRHNTPAPATMGMKLANMTYGHSPPVTVAGIRVPASKVPKQVEIFTLPESELDVFDPPTSDVLNYLRGPERKLSLLSIQEWELCWQPEAQRIGIPVRNVEGALVGISGRAFRKTQKPKFLHSTGFQRQFYLYGEHKIDRQNQTAFLVEGFFDVIKLWQYGYNNVLAIMGSSLNEMQFEKLKRFFSKLVLVPDGDEPGYEAVTKMKQQLHKYFKIKLIPVPEGLDPDELTLEQTHELLGPPQRS